MKRVHLASASSLALALLSTTIVVSPASFAQAAADPLLDVITVRGPRTDTIGTDRIDPAGAAPSGPDTAGILARLPGTAAIGNGALSGQVQYRGLFGPRVNVRIDGMNFASGGPNLMDPPLHYAPPVLIERVEVARGVSPVRHGPGLAGGVDAVFKRVAFTDSSDLSLRYDLSAGWRSTDESLAVGGIAGIANRAMRLHVLASHEDGGDIDFPGGTIGGSRHERDVVGLGFGARSGDHEFGLDLRRQKTGPTGNPPFAMDIRYFDTDVARGTWRSAFGETVVNAFAAWSDVDHAMNNFDLRPAPASMRMYRETYAHATTRSAGVDVTHPLLGGDIRLGMDGKQADHDVTITNPANADFFLTSFPDIGISRFGVFAEWTGNTGIWQGELGLRIDRHNATAGTASTGSAVPPMPGMLAMGFNMSGRETEDMTVDAVARLWRPVSERTTLRVTLARKTRVPTHVERFAWLPTPASGGLADGNTYVGEAGLAPETAWIAEAGLDWSGARAYARPTVFYRRIDDYIQGVLFDATPGVTDSPVEMVSAMNGDPTPLRFGNTDADLWGLDVDFGLRMSARWRLDGVASWVEGERRDIDDALYRITPPNLRLAATYETGSWSATLETLAVAEQDRVAASNSEASTPGHVLINLSGQWQVTEQVHLSAGLENLLDHAYRRHLAGYNRNTGSDVGVGERLPGPGRSFGIRLTIRG